MKKLLNKIIFKISLILKKEMLIPGIDEKREVIDSFRKRYKIKVMVETGTFLGDTVDFFKNKFDSLISIELSEELAKKAVKRFEANENVKIIQGDSGIVLTPLLLEINEKVLFWLDGHYSSEFFVNDEFIRTAKGVKNTPIEKEMNIILQSKIESIILIDDARLFKGRDDYPSIKSIKKIVKDNNKENIVIVDKDIIQIILVKE